MLHYLLLVFTEVYAIRVCLISNLWRFCGDWFNHRFVWKIFNWFAPFFIDKKQKNIKKQAYFWNDWLSDPNFKSSLRHRGSWLLTHLQLKKEKWKKFGYLHMSYQTSQPFLLMESVTYLRWYFQIKKKKTMNSSTLDRAACTSYPVHSKAEQKVSHEL